ncbi:MAG: hypothetical protein KAG14_02285 [Mycoplasmataceae bacterium]|nr:hypothetical protein [Mycoplasmataceae bacterium]
MKHYKIEDKLWVLRELVKGRNRQSIALEFYYKFPNRYIGRNIKLPVILRRIGRLFLDWEYLRDNYGMNRLQKASGNKTNHKGGRPRKVSINDLNENDRKMYQEIIESIIKDHGISKKEISDKMKKEKEKIENIKNLSAVFNINRTNIYYKSTKKAAVFSFNINLMKSIEKLIKKSRNSIGRDKAYITLKAHFKVISYVFRRHWESLWTIKVITTSNIGRNPRKRNTKVFELVIKLISISQVLQKMKFDIQI